MKLKNKLRRIMRSSRKFKKEHKKEIRLLVTFTFGFTMAFAWRQAFFNNSQALLTWFLHIKNSALLNILTASFITIVSFALLRLSSLILKDEN